MYISLEHGESIDSRDVVGIFDIDLAGSAGATKALFKRKEDETGVVSLSSDIPKSFLLCCDGFGDRIYLTGLSTDSVRKRTMRKI